MLQITQYIFCLTWTTFLINSWESLKKQLGFWTGYYAIKKMNFLSCHVIVLGIWVYLHTAYFIFTYIRLIYRNVHFFSFCGKKKYVHPRHLKEIHLLLCTIWCRIIHDLYNNIINRVIYILIKKCGSKKWAKKIRLTVLNELYTNKSLNFNM